MGTGRIPGPLRKTYGTCWTPVFRSLFPPGIDNLLFNSDDCRLILILRIDKIIEKHSHLEFFVENLCILSKNYAQAIKYLLGLISTMIGLISKHSGRSHW